MALQFSSRTCWSQRYAEIARQLGVGFVFDAPTWRTSKDWSDRPGHGDRALAAADRDGIGSTVEVREDLDTAKASGLVSGSVGPRGDGYHQVQIETFARVGVDMITVMATTDAGEAVEMAGSAASVGVPCALSFTVETTDGFRPGRRWAKRSWKSTAGPTPHRPTA